MSETGDRLRPDLAALRGDIQSARGPVRSGKLDRRPTRSGPAVGESEEKDSISAEIDHTGSDHIEIDSDADVGGQGVSGQGVGGDESGGDEVGGGKVGRGVALVGATLGDETLEDAHAPPGSARAHTRQPPVARRTGVEPETAPVRKPRGAGTAVTERAQPGAQLERRQTVALAVQVELKERAGRACRERGVSYTELVMDALDAHYDELQGVFPVRRVRTRLPDPGPRRRRGLGNLTPLYVNWNRVERETLENWVDRFGAGSLSALVSKALELELDG